MSAVYNYDLEIKFEFIELGCCGFATLLPASFIKARKRDHATFYCPSCGSTRYYPQKSDKEILEEQIKAANRGKELAERRAEAAVRSARAHKAAKTRLKNRIKNGVCPCCNRTFSNLHEHMMKQHPDFSEKDNV